MNDPYPRCGSSRTRPFLILYSNKCTIFLVLLAIFLLIFGYSLVQIQQNKLTDDNLALKMSNTFYVVLPSNVTDYPDNRPNKYRVHLPRPLHLTGNYVCALYSIQYPLSWPSTIGTLEPQWIDIKIREEHPIGEYKSVRIPVSSASLKKPTELVEHLRQALKYAQTEVNTTRLRREAAADGGDEISTTTTLADEYAAQPSTAGALCIRRGKRIRCQRRSPLPTVDGQQQKTTVKREAITPPSSVAAAELPSPPPADSSDVNVQNIVTVNVSVEPAVATKSSKPKQPSPAASTTTLGSISVRVDPFVDDDDDDDDGNNQQQQAKKPKPSSPPPKPDIRADSFVDEQQQQQQPKKSTPSTDFQAAFKQLTDLIGAIQIDYLKNANGGDENSSGDEDDEAEQTKRAGKGFENDRFRIRMPHPAISHLEMSEQLAYVSQLLKKSIK